MNQSDAIRENKNEEDEEIEANVTLMDKYLHWKPLKIFFVMFKLIGLNIDLNTKNKRVSIFTWIYFILLLPLSILTIALQIYLVCFMRESDVAELSATNTEHYVLLSAMFVVALRHSQINELVTDSLNILLQFSKNKKFITRSMTKLIIFCTVIGTLEYIMETFIYFKYFLIRTLHNDFWPPPNYFFGIEMSTRTLVQTFNVEYAFYTFQILCSHFFCALLLFILFVINQSYRQLNENFKTEKEKSSKTFMIDHLKMAAIVERFNQVFTPAMFVVLSMHMLDLVTTAYIIYDVSNVDTLPLSTILEIASERMVICLKTLAEFMFLTKFGQEIKNHAQDSISILLKADISNENDKPIPEKSNTTSLFTAKMSSSPVTICANYFVVDYDLVKIAFTIAAAYIAFVEGFNNADKNSTKECNHYNYQYINNYYYANETSNLTAT